MSALQELLAHAHRRAAALRTPDSAPSRSPPDFVAAIRGRDRVHVVAEFKRRSPSEPSLAPAAEVSAQTALYAKAGASALSVLTEPTRFGGSLDDLRAAAATGLPVLMKDFVVAPAQVAAAAHAGASAVLLIARCLTRAALAELVAACAAYRVTPLLECHDGADLRRALACDTAVVGLNNRDLETLRIDLNRVRSLVSEIPRDRVVVAESGYGNPAAIRALAGVTDAVLVGTALMRAEDPVAFLREALS